MWTHIIHTHHKLALLLVSETNCWLKNGRKSADGERGSCHQWSCGQSKATQSILHEKREEHFSMHSCWQINCTLKHIHLLWLHFSLKLIRTERFLELKFSLSLVCILNSNLDFLCFHKFKCLQINGQLSWSTLMFPKPPPIITDAECSSIVL